MFSSRFLLFLIFLEKKMFWGWSVFAKSLISCLVRVNGDYIYIYIYMRAGVDRVGGVGL